MEESIAQACKILERTTEKDKFEYVEAVYYSRGNWKSAYGYYDDYYWGGEYGGNDYAEEENYYYIEFEDHDGKIRYTEEYANSNEEAVGKFCIDYPDIPYGKITCIYD